MSGRESPFRTATATATVASGVSVLATTCPEASTSGYGGCTIGTSNGSPRTTCAFVPPPEPNVAFTLWPVRRSNSGMSFSMAARMPPGATSVTSSARTLDAPQRTSTVARISDRVMGGAIMPLRPTALQAPIYCGAMPSAPFDCDVVVVGGGPAGSTAASWLARAGRRVILLERDRFPRFHIGESLLASVNDVLGAIGADDLVRRAGFPQKWGATFLPADGSIERYLDFSTSADVRAPQTWQVPRATFDDLLLRHAAASGADVRERHRVLDVAFDDDGVTAHVQSTGNGGAARRVRARAIIDASGRGALLSRKFGLRIDEPRLANVAVFSHYSGVPRPDGRRAGDIRVVARDDLGWFWLIPISGELMSVGVVLPRAAFQAFAHLEHDALLERAIAETPAV